MGPDGHVWAADTRGNNVQRWSESLASADLLLDGAQVGGFDHVTGLNFGPDGRLWIVDSWNNRVVPYNPATGTFGTPIGIGGIGDGQLNHPEGVAVSATNVYVADTLNNRVQEFTLGGQFVAQVSAGLITPEGLTLASDGTLWVADTGNSRIRHFDANLVDLTDGFGSLGTDEGQFDRPHSLAAHNGFLYVADTYNHRVQKFRIGENVVPWPGHSPICRSSTICPTNSTAAVTIRSRPSRRPSGTPTVWSSMSVTAAPFRSLNATDIRAIGTAVRDVARQIEESG